MKRWRQQLKRFGFGLLFAFSLMLTAIAPTKLAAQAIDPAGLVQQGVDRYQAGAIQSAIEAWQAALSQYPDQPANAAIVLENLARAYQQIGQTNQEIQYWQQAAALYQQTGDRAQWGRMLTEQAQAFRRLGQSRQAIALLCGATPPDCSPESALELARTARDRLGEAAALGSLGEAYRTRGDYDRAIELLRASLAIAQEINQSAYQSAALNGLGNAQLGLAQISYRQANAAAQVGNSDAAELEQVGRKQDAAAIESFQQSLTIAQQQGDQLAQLRAIVDALPAYYRTEDPAAAAVLEQAIDLLTALPNSPDKVYLAIDLVSLLDPGESCATSSTALTLLQQATTTAEQLDDPRSESFALGGLGRFYECQRDYEQAIALTQQARWAAEQNLRAQDSLYLWEWQTGRILAAQGNKEQAIAAYDKAVTTLETIRSELLNADRDLQFDFRDTVDPIYRELVELRLSTTTPENIRKALKNLDALRLAELQNYFGDDCVIVAAPESIEAAPEAATAIFSSVVLADRTAIILSLPNGEQRIEWIEIDRDRLTTEVNDYRQQLERFYRRFETQQARKMYDWIIAPFAEVLEQSQVETLVFVQDGILRSIPMAASHDGEQYLIQKYAIATTPSLTLTAAQPLDRSRLRALVLGLTQTAEIDGQIFPALSNVNREVAAIEAELNTTPLLDQSFTTTRLQQALSQTSYSIIHMATHGQFSTVPEDTFLITGDRQKLTITDLDRILRQTTTTHSIELLSLTACQTAVGDDRAALGLAGVAIQAGVRSALASLWYIDDAATAQLATEFYANLQNPSFSRADALRAAQISLLENRQTANPAYWAPFILIGNWR